MRHSLTAVTADDPKTNVVLILIDDLGRREEREGDRSHLGRLAPYGRKQNPGSRDRSRFYFSEKDLNLVFGICSMLSLPEHDQVQVAEDQQQQRRQQERATCPDYATFGLRYGVLRTDRYFGSRRFQPRL